MSRSGRTIVVGAGGMLGRAVVEHLRARDADFVSFDRGTLDITDAEAVGRGVARGTEVIVNCAAWTDVDGAESQEAAAMAVNGRGPGVLAQRAQSVGATLIHFSTDYVFAGEGRLAYPVDAPPNPVNAYGRSKAAGEAAVRAVSGEHLIVRTSWLYAPWGRNFVRTIAEAATQRRPLRVVADQVGRPSSATQLVKTTMALLHAGARGTFHAADSGSCSWFDLAALVVERVAPGFPVEPCTSADFPRPAPRPAYSVLDLSRTTALVGELPAWPDSVAATLDAMKLNA